MAKGTQQDYWNSRAEAWGDYGVPLIPSNPEIDFQRQQLVPGGVALVLGATPELCTMALDVSDTVTAVDFASAVIHVLRRDEVSYVCKDWLAFFEQTTDQFDNIMTDGGLVCLEFPGLWRALVEQVHAHLRPGGIFTARVYVSTPEMPKDHYSNPNLGRFVSSMAGASAANDWMPPLGPAYEDFDMRYAFPPREKVLETIGQLGRFTLVGEFTPDYDEGQRFLSLAWQRPVD